jgi:hypothetical protein
MSTPDAPLPTRKRSSVISLALLVVLAGTGLLAVQNCGGAPPAPSPPPPTPSTTAPVLPAVT